MNLTRRQQQIYDILRSDSDLLEQPPTYEELCTRLGLSSRGSLHKHIKALIDAGLIEPMAGRQRGIRLSESARAEEGIPLLGSIAAGRPIEAITQSEMMRVPEDMLNSKPSYVLQVSGASMIDEGIFDGDYVVIESSDTASNGDIVVALINGEEVTLKRIEQLPGKVILYPANSNMSEMVFEPDEVQIQGILIGLLRYYR
ncbi:MAG: transcriptional repressor LexA [Candidatus Thiodiazotropha sp. 6PLUC2]